ncbi:ClpXP protease specificity-enhancing factor [Thiothrix subterranea]|uniref:ClpXP protease specificity-enhancing factor n=1 Tax=Thiothrix subterranea TaxID=2735563 RepID=UPI00192CDCAB|nr:ClpXP protease specificity-enhancing factor [Thiothrix subterranea]QQZ30102.1 ClpXP protease specificity-enhancing factor [Thiothrix subterranea]
MSQPNPPEFIATPKRPYLLRAFYEWIVDNGMTPHIMVDARSPKVKVPRQFVKDGSIVLNVSMTAANNLLMDNDQVTFNARFGGKAMSIWLPMWSIMAIYARETQDGLNFPLEEYAESMALTEAATSRPTLASVPAADATVSDTDASDEADATDDANGDDEPPPPPKPTSRPSFLRVVK